MSLTGSWVAAAWGPAGEDQPRVVLPDNCEWLTQTPFKSADEALAAAAEAGATAVLLLREGQDLPPLALERLARAAGENPAATVVSALHPHRLFPEDTADSDPHLADWVAWNTGQRSVVSDDELNPDCCLWRLNAAEPATPSLKQAPELAHRGELVTLNHLVAGVSSDRPPGKVDPRDRPAADWISALRTALWQFSSQPQPVTPTDRPGLDPQPVLLHVLHSWGGGTERWVRDTVDAWEDAQHLCLMAWANPASSNHGQELRLRAGGPNGPVLRRWALSPAITATAAHHGIYQQVLARIISDYGVSALIVSSLIGHSLDALRTGLPTLNVVHDFYPVWPDLSLRLEDPAAAFDDNTLTDALAGSHFSALPRSRWITLREQWQEAVTTADVIMIAPSDFVAEGLRKLLRENAPAPRTVPHGLRRFDQAAAPYRAPAPGERLRLLVPGRISEAKGAQLLREALPQISEVADVILLGGGRYAHEFFGVNHVHIVLEYQWQELPALVALFKPHAALILSTVSETFNYTLSEMWALELPVVATRVGALAHRIKADATGMLIAPEPQALADAIAALDAERLARLAQAAKPVRSLAAAAEEYRTLLQLPDPKPLRYSLSPNPLSELAGAAAARGLREAGQRVTVLEAQTRELRIEVEESARWAQAEARRADEKTLWAKELDHDLNETRDALGTLQEEFDERTEWALSLNSALEELRTQAVSVAEELEMVLATRSWKITRPLRAAARIGRAALAGFGLQERRAKTMAERARKSLRVRGLRGTMQRIGQEFSRGEPQVGPQLMIDAAEDQPFVALEFPEVSDPVASIVIPVYNHYHHTQACLRSLLETRSALPFEVLVVDDASADETPDRLAEHQGITVLRNPENLGFIGTCNRGAAEARGRYLIFLNNDTQVTDGWLDRLLQTFDDHPDTGLAGAKLVYPDGRLQEAGGIVFSDGSGWNYGRFDAPAAPHANFVREVDYCSGAAIAIHRALFDELGGFDLRYKPAYYEDTDLAFAVRAHGLKVRYQPASQVVHFEGITSGTDVTRGVKRYQVVNQEKFVERWRDDLPRQPAAGSPIEVARRHRRPHSVLIVDACMPTPDQDSGSVRMVNLLRLLLDLNCHVQFVAENRAYDEKYTPPLQQLGVEVLYHPFVKSLHSYLKENGEHLDTVILSRHYIASNHIESVRRFCPKAQLIFDTVDLHYLREQRQAELERDAGLEATARKTRARELDVARRSDLTLVVSDYEQRFLAQDAPDLPVSVLSNIHPVHGCRRGFEEREGLLFVGGFQHPPNVDGITWFVREVLPLARQSLPDLKLTVIGSKMPPAVEQLAGPGVEVLGYVPDIEPYLDGCRLSLAPLRYGAGVKGKVNMAMSYGQPVVATGPAVEGMHVQPGADVLVADAAADFAAAVVRGYTDQELWESLSKAGLANVETHFSFAAARRALEGILKPGSDLLGV
ncbi:MAG: glycosyltransferase [Pseudomonadota bacterium]